MMLGTDSLLKISASLFKRLSASKLSIGMAVCVIYLCIGVLSVQAQQTPAESEYVDTEFGEYLYNEASVATRLEVLSLLSKETPSTFVFLHAISMGLGIEDVLQAAVQYEPEKARDFAESAISILPLLSDSEDYSYSEYELEDLERRDEQIPYSVADVAERFFENREILTPRPDWTEGQYHFQASVNELKQFELKPGQDIVWYQERDGVSAPTDRPIFVSLHEFDESILIDGEERLENADEDALLPVVFIFNKERERAIDHLVKTHKYPRTILGVQQAYNEHSLMLTPTPEWQLGEHHIDAQIEEVYDVFHMPKQEDFEPEHWDRLLVEAHKYKRTEQAFLIVVLEPDDEEDRIAFLERSALRQYAVYEDPRRGAAFPYVASSDDDGDVLSTQFLVNRGLIINRPDLIAALKAIGVTNIPVVFYYVDNARTKPYSLGPRALRLFVTGIQPPGLPGGGGGFGPPSLVPTCASPPCGN